MNNLGDLGLKKESEMVHVNQLLCFILWTSEIGAGRRSGPVVRGRLEQMENSPRAVPWLSQAGVLMGRGVLGSS